MGISEKSGIQYTGHLVEVRESPKHKRISAHGATQFIEVMFFPDQSVIVIDINRVEKQAIQTVYSPNGDIEVLIAGWSYEENGYHGPYERVHVSSGNESECKSQWLKYDVLINEASEKNCRCNF